MVVNQGYRIEPGHEEAKAHKWIRHKKTQQKEGTGPYFYSQVPDYFTEEDLKTKGRLSMVYNPAEFCDGPTEEYILEELNYWKGVEKNVEEHLSFWAHLLLEKCAEKGRQKNSGEKE
jgi:hypothetical protein